MQNLLVLYANLESSKNHLVVKPSELFCFKDTINVAMLLVFLGGVNRQCICVKYFELRANRLRIKIYGKIPAEKFNILSTYMQFFTQHILSKNIREFCMAIPVG